MNIELTRDTQKVAAKIYKEYLTKIKNGKSKNEACKFSESELTKLFTKEEPIDYESELQELIKVFSFSTNIWDDITLSSSFIIYMENRFNNGLKDVLSFLSQFIP